MARRMMITPELAKEWLTHNKNNRSVDRKTVNKYKYDILNGHWKYNGQPIVFTVSGALADGQHRLIAIVETGISCESMVVDDVADDLEVMATINSGKGNNAQNLLEIMDAEDIIKKNQVIALIRFMVHVRRGDSTLSPNEIRDEYYQHMVAVQYIQSIGGFTAIRKPGKTVPAVMNYFLLVAYENGYDNDALRKFVKSYQTAEHFTGYNSKHAINLRYMQPDRKKIKAQLMEVEDAYNSYVNNYKTLSHKNNNRLFNP